MKVFIRAVGCDGLSEIEADVTDAEFTFLEGIAKAIQEKSTYGCEAILVVETSEAQKMNEVCEYCDDPECDGYCWDEDEEDEDE